MKLSQLDKAILHVEADLADLQRVRDRLVAVRDSLKPRVKKAKKPQLVTDGKSA